MEIQHLEPTIKDKRGFILDILTNEPIEHVTVISSQKGGIRGNHYHKETIQWVYLHSGQLKSLTQFEGETVITKVLNPGDLIRTDKLERHALHAMEDSIFFVFTKGPRGGDNYENDTFRLETPLTPEGTI